MIKFSMNTAVNYLFQCVIIFILRKYTN